MPRERPSEPPKPTFVDLTTDDIRNLTPIPKRIGRYRILGRIGEGGMGVVYAAEQDNPRRLVALKVVRSALASEGALRRFAFESEVLGRLQHPCIAQIHDAGIAPQDDGAKVPYFAMEKVEGEPLDDYANEHGLSIRARVELFATICDGIEHAHRKGVIHRDLKPANILVDADGRPRVLDFGVARLAENTTPGETVLTRVGTIVGTLAYMSPEQADGDASCVDTRSDVYSLGVILYELLAGSRPYDVTRTSVSESIRVIRETAPPPISTRVREARGDLETIVEKALAKEQDQRYGSAAALADDLRRFLRFEPILARPPGRLYRTVKFARRHAVAVGAAVLLAFTLAGGLVATIWQARAAERQRVAAENARDQTKVIDEYLTNDMLGAGDPRLLGRDTRLVEVLDRAREGVAKRFAGQALLEASVRDALGQRYLALGVANVAVEETERAVALRTAELGAEHPETLTARLHFVEALQGAGMSRRALEETEAALQAERRVNGPEHPETLTILNNLSVVLHQVGDSERALATAREAVALREKTLGLDHARTLTSKANLASMLWQLGQLDESIALLEKTLDAQRRVLGADHPDVMHSEYNLAQSLEDARRGPDAEAGFRALLEKSRRVYGEDHPAIAAPMLALGGCLARQGRNAEGEQLIRRALELRTAALGRSHALTLEALRELIHFESETGASAEAERLATSLVATIRESKDSNAQEMIAALASLGRAQRANRRLEDAAATYRESLAIGLAKLGPNHQDVGQSHYNLGVVLRDLGDLEGSADHFKHAILVDTAVFGEENLNVAGDRFELARTRIAQDRRADALELTERVLAMQRRQLAPDNPGLAATKLLQADSLIALGRAAEACPLIEEALATIEAARGPDHVRTREARAALERCRAALTK